MKSWFTAFLSRSTVGVSPARRFKTPFLGIAIFLAGLAASGVALRAQTVSTFASGFSQPTALAFDAAGNLYVTNAGPGSNTVSKVTSGGGVTQFANGFSYPNGLACDTAGNLYVANYIDGTVSKVTSGGSGSTFASGFNGPVGLACDAAGNLYVANRNGGTVSKVTSGGSITVFASGLTSPTSLAFDAAGNLYVSSSATTVSKIPSGGGAPTNFATAPYEVYGMVFDAAGNLYLVSRDPGIVSKITPGGSVSTVVSGLSYTDALARDAAGNLYVASDTLGVVSKITLPTPSITGISPTSGAAAGGTSVVITGTNFTGVTAVTFGATAAASYTFNSATQITATSPGTSAGTVHITVTTADGTSATSAADQFTFVNAPPSVGNLEGDSVTFTEGGSAVKLDTGSNATVTDTDSANFNGGNVTVSIAANRVTGEDVLSIRHQGTGAGEIGVSGGNVTYAGTTIGTFAGGAGTSDLVVTLNANATPTNVGALLRNLTYANTNTSDPSTSARTVRVTVNDGDGGTSTAADVTVTVTAVNDAPTLTATGLNPTFGEGGPAIDLFGSVIASTGDSGQTFAALTLIVTNVANGANEFLSIGGTDVALTSGNSGTLTGLGSFSVSVAGGTATVSVTGLTRSSAQMATLVDGLAYRNTAAPPNTTARVVTLTGIQDNGGTANGGVDSAALSVASTVSIDLAPTLSGRSEPGAGTYIIGQALNFTVSYSENVTVNTGGGTPYLAVTLATGGSVQAPYASGTGTTTLTFRYTVASGHLDADGIAVASAITLNGGTIKDSANLDAPTTSLGFGSTTAVLVDGVAPTLASSNRQTPAASATNATSVLYRVTFAEAVTGVDSADFTLTPTGSAGGTIVSVNAVSSTVYDVTVNAISGAGTLRLDLKNAGTGIADLVGNGIATGYTSGQTYTIDTTAAVVTSVSAPAAATYVAGQNLDFTVNWDENVTVDPAGGTPTIALTVGSTNRSATYQSGSGSTALVFRYTTQAGDVDADGPAVASAIALHGGTIKDSAGNDATLTLNSVGSTAAVLVDALAPTVTGTTVPANGTYKTGQHLDFTVTYSENVTVVGAPYVAVTLATGGTVQAAYQGGTGTTTLTFRSTVASGNLDADGIAVASAITLNGGTIKDATGNDAATTSLGFAATTGVLVDGVAPTVASIGRQAPSGASTNATSVTYRVTFAEAVTGVDTADFALTTTGTAAGAIASLNAVSGTVYDVTVNTISGAGTLRLDLNSAGTGIADAVTNAIATGFTTGETYTIDNTAPTLSTIARQTPTTVHTDTATATWRVTFAEDVTGVDATDFTATAVSGTGSGTVAAVTPVSATAYDVVVNLTGQARLRLDLKSTGTGIADLAGNALADGGFTTGDFYLTGITSVFDTSAVTPNGFVIVAAGGTKVAQRFRTAAGQPLTLSSVTALLKTINGTPSPVVQILADNAGAPGSTVIATLTNPASLTADALNVWTGSALLTASTTYWVAFSDTSASASYEIQLSTVATTGGTGTWLTSPTDYKFHYGASLENSVGSVLKVALGATSTPAISSSLTASATVGAAFSYQTEATNTPSSYTAAGLPSGLSLNGATGAITGTPTQAGTFNVTLRATNASGTGPDSPLVLTVAKGTATVTLGSMAQTYNSLPRAATATTNPPGLSVSLLYNGSMSAPTGVGRYAVSATVSDPNYNGSATGTLTIEAAEAVVTLSNLLHSYDGSPKSATATASLPGLAVTITYDGRSTAPTAAGSYRVEATVASSGYSGRATGTLTIRPGVAVPPVVTPGHATTLSAVDSGVGAGGHWQRNGADLANATGLTLTLPNVQPPTAGLYTYTATAPGGGIASSEPLIVGLSTTEEVVGTASQVGEDIRHPNGNVYDQVLLGGPAATLTAEPSKITRTSYIDLNGDIVQVELSGAGALSLIVDDAGTPAPAQNYNQPGVSYVQGHAGIVITGADATTNVSVFTVGRITAVNQSLFKAGVSYDGVADLAFIAIQSKDGKFGGIRTGNVSYFATQGFTGIYAPGVDVMGPINVGDINAHDSAQAVLVTGSVASVKVCGGNLEQANGQPVQVSGLGEVQFVVGTTSHGGVLAAQNNAAKLIEDGVDVTALLVKNPSNG